MASTQGSRLLGLPAEVRSMIWLHVLTISEQPVRMVHSPRAGYTTSVLRILTVCKTIYRDAHLLFYKHNTLYLSSPAALYHFLSAVPILRRHEISKLIVGNFGYSYFGHQVAAKAFCLLNLCPRLNSFTLDLTLEKDWKILEEKPEGISEKEWMVFSHAIHCLETAVRGIKHASIRGLDPQLFADGSPKELTSLTEVPTQRAAELKSLWSLRKPMPASTRVERTLMDAAKARLKGNKGKEREIDSVERDGSAEPSEPTVLDMVIRGKTEGKRSFGEMLNPEFEKMAEAGNIAQMTQFGSMTRSEYRLIDIFYTQQEKDIKEYFPFHKSDSDDED